ncbi:MAG: 2-dehydro-3-deoxy-6-phosphogalactonate aldolase [Caulobacter sp.]|nr:2-dehydro-3-deoxy-6-phosphogalactonate aldolase [Caulobacter sp.]
MSWFDRIADLPLVAILRGLRPEEALDMAGVLHDAGFRCLEVPLNSPEPLESIRRISEAFGDRLLVGAGTVLTVAAVEAVAEAGGRLIVSPNADITVIAAAKARGLVSLPGMFTPSEAFAALAAGADGLKLFPAEAASPTVLKAMKAVLPADAPVFVVGGVTPETMAPWRTAGAQGFGLGSALYKPGRPVAEVEAAAAAFAAAWRKD